MQPYGWGNEMHISWGRPRQQSVLNKTNKPGSTTCAGQFRRLFVDGEGHFKWKTSEATKHSTAHFNNRAHICPPLSAVVRRSVRSADGRRYNCAISHVTRAGPPQEQNVLMGASIIVVVCVAYRGPSVLGFIQTHSQRQSLLQRAYPLTRQGRQKGY